MEELSVLVAEHLSVCLVYTSLYDEAVLSCLYRYIVERGVDGNWKDGWIDGRSGSFGFLASQHSREGMCNDRKGKHY